MTDCSIYLWQIEANSYFVNSTDAYDQLIYDKLIDPVLEKGQLSLSAALKQTYPVALPLTNDALLRSYLSNREKIRADRFRLDRDKQYYLLAHHILRLILSANVECSPGEISLRYSNAGKPYLSDRDNIVAFNLSHSGIYMAVAVAKPAKPIGTNCKIGVDVEQDNRDLNFKQLASRYFSPAECSLMSMGNERHQFFEIWTRKEAVLKATGEGLTGLDRISVNKDVIQLENREGSFDSYRLASRHFEPDLYLSLAKLDAD